jgi:hypothetical protein
MITTLTVRMEIKRCQQKHAHCQVWMLSLKLCRWARAPVAAFFDDTHLPAATPMNSDNNATMQTNPAEPPLVPNNQLPPAENKLFRKWRREFSLITGYGIDPAERVFTINRRNCERWKKDLLNYSMSFLIRFSSLRSWVI